MEDELLASPETQNAATTPSKWEAIGREIKKITYIATPMVVVTVSQNLLRVVSMIMVGHLGELSLSGAAVATSLTNVTGFSLLFGMACALETLCGQAYGAGQYRYLGSYTYASILSLLVVCVPISVLWIFMDKLLIKIGQDPLVAVEAGKYSIGLIPTLYPYAILQSLVRYFQAQSLLLPMLVSSVVSLLFHIPLSWALVFKFELGAPGASLAIGLSYWLNVILLVLYVMFSSSCERTRVSGARDVFSSISEFFRVGVPSAVMICLEWWSEEIIILLSGLLPNSRLETSVLSICLTVSTMHYFIPYSFGAAASTRVSNELGAGHPEAAKLAVWVVVVLAMAEVLIAGIILLCCRSFLGYAFGEAKEVVDYVKNMTPLLCFSIIVDCLHAIFCGVARGTGWQDLGAYVNLGAYYLVGIPVALVLGFVLHFRAKGLWMGLTTGAVVQASLLFVITYFTDWKTKAAKARERVFVGRNSSELLLMYPIVSPSKLYYYLYHPNLHGPHYDHDTHPSLSLLDSAVFTFGTRLS